MKSKKIFLVSFALIILAFSYFAISAEFLISDSYTIMEGASLNSSLPFGIYANNDFYLNTTSDTSPKAKTFSEKSEGYATLKLFNVIPVKEVSVNIIKRPLLYPSGECIGIKLYSQGILITGFSDFETKEGICISPAASTGLKNGDIIKKINGTPVSKISDFTNIADKSGEKCTLTVKRNGKEMDFAVKPKRASDGHMRMGILVKNSVAGVGTMTYTTDSNESFAALGHGISDEDVLIPLKTASAYRAQIIDIKKGERGNPGEIIAAINEDEPIGKCTQNTSGGIYGLLNEYTPHKKAVYAAPNNEIKRGAASILCTIDPSGIPREYRVEILSVNAFRKNKSKSFTLKVTDEDLLRKTGGIIQGMSGSPIIQSGKIIGAVTHVFVNDPTKGYGIFIENMLAEAEKIK